MSGLEGPSSAHDGSRSTEPAVSHDAAEPRIELEAPIDHGEGREVDDGLTNHLGYKDRECREFRKEHPDEYLEPMSRSSPVEPFADPADVVEHVNPDYGSTTDGAYENNCADCARCVERTWRGHREEAAGRAAVAGEDGVLRVEGEYDDRTQEWADEKFSDPTDDPANLKRRLLDGGHGTSAIIHSEYTDDEGDLHGHAYNAVNHEGRVHVLDGQQKQVMDWDDSTIHPWFHESSDHRVMMWDPTGGRIF